MSVLGLEIWFIMIKYFLNGSWSKVDLALTLMTDHPAHFTKIQCALYRAEKKPYPA